MSALPRRRVSGERLHEADNRETSSGSGINTSTWELEIGEQKLNN